MENNKGLMNHTDRYSIENRKETCTGTAVPDFLIYITNVLDWLSIVPDFASEVQWGCIKSHRLQNVDRKGERRIQDA